MLFIIIVLFGLNKLELDFYLLFPHIEVKHGKNMVFYHFFHVSDKTARPDPVRLYPTRPEAARTSRFLTGPFLNSWKDANSKF